LRITFFGVRGSTPVEGPEFARVGGHTSCIGVSIGDALPCLVLDAGTGLQSVTALFGARPFDGTILLTHLHWDHMQGLPFFPPADRDGARVTLVQPAQGDPLEVLAGVMTPPYFPIRPDELGGSWAFVALEPSVSEFEGFRVSAREIPHKGGRTYGYRIEREGRALAYLPDHCPSSFGPGPEGFGEYHAAALELVDRADVLVHGAPFVVGELERATLFGHATAEYAAGLAQHAGVDRLVLTHHGPTRTDDEVDAIARRVGAHAAIEGTHLDV
jgi:phosphoribosyl 1,2-cyclic phosphodiesterase